MSTRVKKGFRVSKMIVSLGSMPGRVWYNRFNGDCVLYCRMHTTNSLCSCIGQW